LPAGGGVKLKLTVLATVASLWQLSLWAGSQNAATTTPAFDAASIKKSVPGPGGILYHLPGGRFKVERYTLLKMISFSYDIPEIRITGLPGWASSEQFDVEATAEGHAESDPKKMEGPIKKAMVRQLLAERFGLEVRQEEKDAPIYALTVVANGPRLERNTDKAYSIQAGKRSFTFRRVSMGDFAKFLTTNLNKDLGRTVVDRTALTGEFDFKLIWMPVSVLSSNLSPDDPPPIFTALEQELGLKLHPDRTLETFLLVTHASLPSAN
jgi:uncharacterized protein (TIGR03435 family)